LITTFANPGVNASPHISPDGSTLIFARNDTGLPGWDIWKANADGSSPAVYAPLSSPNTDKQPSWSRTGSDVLFVSDRAVLNTFQLYYGDGALTQIADGYHDEINPHWMP